MNPSNRSIEYMQFNKQLIAYEQIHPLSVHSALLDPLQMFITSKITFNVFITLPNNMKNWIVLSIKVRDQLNKYRRPEKWLVI
jgi:hypothetical protein